MYKSADSTIRKTGDNCYRFPSISDFSVAEYRASTGLSQAEFAAEHEISLSTLRKWEQHQSEPKVSTVAHILDAWIREKLALVTRFTTNAA